MPRITIPTAFLLLFSSSVGAADFTVEVRNLTRFSYFTPLLVAVHADSSNLFAAGSAASANLRSMAEGGDVSGLAADLNAAGAGVVSNPAGGLLAPGATTSASLSNTGNSANTELTVVGMILPSNDGFMALNSLTVPTAPGTYVYTLNAYDAGTEGNDEIRGSGAVGMPGMPVPPPLNASVGTGGTGVTTTAEGFVHIHRGVLGDTNSTGGNSDIDATLHRWLNPVARVTVTVQ